MAEQVAIRIRQHHCKTGCVHLHIGTSILETRPGFSHQMKIPITVLLQSFKSTIK